MSRYSLALILLLLVSLALNVYWWQGRGYDLANDVKVAANAGGASQQTSQGIGAAAIARRSAGLAIDSADLNLLFESGDFADAFDGLGWLAGQSPEQAARIEQGWLARVREWLQLAPGDRRVRDFVDAALDSDPNEFEYRRLAAERLAATANVLEAIDRYYELLNESPQHLQGVLAADIQRLVKHEVAQLSEAQAWPPLIRLAERLLWHEPMHPPWIFVYARALVEEKRFASARNSLRSVLYDEYYGGKARQMLEEIERMDLADEAVPLRSLGSHYLVDGKINGSDTVALMIDTGATLSVISPSALRTARVSPAPVFVRDATINTAGGKVQAPIYRVESFSIGDYSVPNMEFVVLELEDKSTGAGLLGMNFLRNFTFRLDQKNNLLLLSAP
ncbi:MAG: retropepsin-like aspartic protease [Pseudomonadales bacterium]